MKFTLKWLKDHLATDASLEDVLLTLTRIGHEVESVENPAAKLAPFVIARVLTAAPHPQADKLQVLTVDAGDGIPQQVVCGAPNARAGLVGVFGAPGAYVPGSDLTLKVAAIRGVESRGMMCSERELELSGEHDGIIDLPADAPVGTAYAIYAGLDDPVIDVAITPNRQDCMGVRGIARDLAAAGLGRLKPLAEAYGVASLDVLRSGAGPDVRTDDAIGCPAFYACSVAGVVNGASPAWLQQKLRAIGQKPISALVDITNFIMFDLGRPLHVYDRARLQGALVARKARDGEQVQALNGKLYALSPTMTVIADDSEVHDIGGIMGGMHSGCSNTTTDVLIECAYFDPEGIARTGQRLTLTSDARTRFERGVDPAFLDDGLAVATHLVRSLCGGTASELTRSGHPPLGTRIIAYRPEQVGALAGIEIASTMQADILSRLGFGVTVGDVWQVTVPSWRHDIDGSADLVEEVVRITGFDSVPSTPLPRSEGVAKPTTTAAQLIERRVRRTIAARGLNEAVTWSFISPDEAAPFGDGVWTLENAISAELAVMRPSMLPGLLSAARRNADRGQPNLRLFELGRRYLGDTERPTAGILLTGDRAERDWRGGRPIAVDAFDAKAEALAGLAAAGVPVERLLVMDQASAWYHPGRSGRLCLGPKTTLAEFGELHPGVARHFGLRTAVAVAELFLDAIPQPRGSLKRNRPVYAPPSLQPVSRDFAFVVAPDASADALLRAVRGADKAAILSATLFDVFVLPDGERSLAVAVTLQPVDRSFTDAEIEALSAKIVEAAAKAGAKLRI